MNTSLNQLLFDTDTMNKIKLGTFKIQVPVLDNDHPQYDKINNVIDLNNNDTTLSSKRKYINLTDVLYDRTEFEKIINCNFSYFTFPDELTQDEEDMLAQGDAAMYVEDNLISDTLMCTNKETGEQVYLIALESDTITSTNCLLSPNKLALAIIQSDGNFCIYMNTDTTKPVINDDYTWATPTMCVWNTGWTYDLIDHNGVGEKYDGVEDIYGNKFCVFLNKKNKYQYKRKDTNNKTELSKNVDERLTFAHHYPFVYIHPQTTQEMNDGALEVGRNMTEMLGDNGWFINWWTGATSNATLASKASYLKLDDDGVLTLYNQGDTQLWTSRY